MVIELKEQFKNIQDYVSLKIHEGVVKYNLSTSENIESNLSIHLSLSVARELSGNNIEMSQSQLEQCKSLHTIEAAKYIIENIQKEYDITLPETDSYYTAMYLADMSLLDLDFDVEFDIVDDSIESIINETLDIIQNELGYNLRDNKDFCKGMSLHFYPAIERLEEDKQIDSNPMIKEISQYELPLKCANILNDTVKKRLNKSFNENELSYITLHFGTAFYSEA